MEEIGSSNYQLTTIQYLFQVHRPVRVVEERFPARVLGVSEFDRQQRAALGADRSLDHLESGFLRCAAALANVATDARANQVFPGRIAAAARGHHVIQAQLARGES